jgi:hypothetical protein
MPLLISLFIPSICSLVLLVLFNIISATGYVADATSHVTDLATQLAGERPAVLERRALLTTINMQYCLFG